MPYISPENDNRDCESCNRGCEVLNRFIAQIFGFLCFSSHAFYASISAKCRFFSKLYNRIKELPNYGIEVKGLLPLPVTNY